MLRDALFYPLAALLVAGMIAFALSLGGGDALTDEEIVAEGWTLEGPALRNLTVSPGINMSYRDAEGGYVQLSAFTPYDVGPGSIGTFATLGPDHERAFAGRPLRVTLRARRAARDGLQAFDTAYFPVEALPSPWAVFPLEDDWTEHSFEFTPPIVAAEPNVDLLSVFPGKAGEQKVMDLAAIRIEVIGDDAP